VVVPLASEDLGSACAIDGDVVSVRECETLEGRGGGSHPSLV
jgi:hypothetical protein